MDKQVNQVPSGFDDLLHNLKHRRQGLRENLLTSPPPPSAPSEAGLALQRSGLCTQRVNEAFSHLSPRELVGLASSAGGLASDRYCKSVTQDQQTRDLYCTFL